MNIFAVFSILAVVLFLFFVLLYRIEKQYLDISRDIQSTTETFIQSMDTNQQVNAVYQELIAKMIDNIAELKIAVKTQGNTKD